MEQNLKILMISSDRNVLSLGSPVSERIKEYGAMVEELHIVLLSNSSHNLKEGQIGGNVFIYPTNSSASFLRPLDAARLGKKIIFNKGFIRGRSLITADSIEGGWAGLKIKRKWRIPLEVQLHADIFSPYFSGFQNKVRKFFAGKILSNADAVRVVSEELKSQVVNMTNTFVYVLPIYIDRSKIEEKTIAFDIHSRYPWHFILLMVSRLAPEKNIPLAIEILSIIRKRFLDIGLVIVGSGPEESRLKALVKKSNLIGAVEFTGWRDDTASFYLTANAFLQTSLFEGYGLSLIEAGLSNLPVITTPVGIAKELTHGKDAYIYPATDPEAFANGIIDLIENNNKRENLRFNMKKTLESKLITKENYLKELSSEWGRTASRIG